MNVVFCAAEQSVELQLERRRQGNARKVFYIDLMNRFVEAASPSDSSVEPDLHFARGSEVGCSMTCARCDWLQVYSSTCF